MRSAVIVVAIVAAACSGAASTDLADQTPAPGRPTMVPPAPDRPQSTPEKQAGKSSVVTGLVGSVVLGPTAALGRPGRSGSKPVANARMIVSQPGEGGAQVASAATDDTGRFEVSLPAGTYRVTIETAVEYRFTKELPATVTIVKGATTPLNVVLDTGIR